MTPFASDELPEGWRGVRFGDIVRWENGRVDPELDGIERYVAGEHMETDDLEIRRWGTVGDGYLGPAFYRPFAPGQVLYGSRRTYLRKVALARFAGVCSEKTFVLEPASSELLPEFLPHLMSVEAFHEFAVLNSRGSTNPYLNASDLADYTFELPPVEVQRAFLELLDAHTDVLERCRTVVAACEATLFAIEREVFGQSDHMRLEDAAEVRLGRQRSPKFETGDYIVPYLRAANVKHGHFELDDIKAMNFEPDEQAVFRLRRDDILVTEGCGALNEIGASARWEGSSEVVCFQNTLLRLRAFGSTPPPLLWYWADFAFRSGMFRRIATGTSIWHLSSDRTKALPFPRLDAGSAASAVARLQAAERLLLSARKSYEDAKSSLAATREGLLRGSRVL